MRASLRAFFRGRFVFEFIQKKLCSFLVATFFHAGSVRILQTRLIILHVSGVVRLLHFSRTVLSFFFFFKTRTILSRRSLPKK